MKQFNGFDEAKESAKNMGGEKLPAGAYVCKILGVKYQEGTNGNSDMIAIQFDIAEGEYKDFFKSQYESSTREDKKYKGKTTIYCPKDDGSEKDSWTKNAFARWINAFEDSNNGFKWAWDESKLKGLTVGIVFGETGTVIDGNEIVYTEARFACDAAKVREGKAPEAKFKAKNGYGDKTTPATTNDGFMAIGGTEEQLPWD